MLLTVECLHISAKEQLKGKSDYVMSIEIHVLKINISWQTRIKELILLIIFICE